MKPRAELGFDLKDAVASGAARRRVSIRMSWANTEPQRRARPLDAQALRPGLALDRGFRHPVAMGVAAPEIAPALKITRDQLGPGVQRQSLLGLLYRSGPVRPPGRPGRAQVGSDRIYGGVRRFLRGDRLCLGLEQPVVDPRGLRIGLGGALPNLLALAGRGGDAGTLLHPKLVALTRLGHAARRGSPRRRRGGGDELARHLFAGWAARRCCSWRR